jgi:hypothetical protein
MVVRFCRDCVNFEDRRDIDGVALCKMNVGPYVCCVEFKPRQESMNADRIYNRFCVECANFEDVDGISLCAKNHTPGVACDGFESRYGKLNMVQENNRMKTVLVAYTAKHYDFEPVPESLIMIGRKIRW